jgi:hypothetical protein
MVKISHHFKTGLLKTGLVVRYLDPVCILLDLRMKEMDTAEGMLQARGRALNCALQQDWTTAANNNKINLRLEDWTAAI